MLFSSFMFVLQFLPIFLILYYLAPARFRNLILMIGSLIFYGVGEPKYILLLIGSTIVNYGFYWIYKEKGYKWILIFSAIVDIGVLFLFKLLGTAILGISFYTFQVVAFLLDCYKDQEKEVVSFSSFITYICMFPKLTSGPITRYGSIKENLAEPKVCLLDLEEGLKLFAAGLALKVLLANQIGTLWNSILTTGIDSLSVSVAWLGAFAYSFQLYFDFWGYSVMAVGIGRMLGYQFPENFRQPYLSKSVSDFWRRWHITLGQWFRDYVYIPLGGNRKGRGRTFCNLFIVWILTGLWHGLSLNFILWGLLFFVMISVEKMGFGVVLEKSRVLGHVYIIMVLPLSWMLFAFSDWGQMCGYFSSLFGRNSGEVMVKSAQLLRYLHSYGPILIGCVLASTNLPQTLYRKYNKKWYGIVILLLLFGISMYEIHVGNNNPFLYFRF